MKTDNSALAPAVAEDPPLQLAVVVPVLNEAGNVGPLFDALTQALAAYQWEVIFVDDGSTDGTIGKIDQLALTHRHVRAVKRFGRGGLASAVIEGAMGSAAPVIAVIDGDMQHDETRIPLMVEAINTGTADMVVGTRYAQDGSADGLSDVRLKGSLLVTRFTNALMRTRCSDPMSGFFAIRRDKLAELRPRLSSIGFKIVLDLLVTGRGKLRMTEVPFRFRGRASGESKMSVKIVTELLTFFVDRTIGRILPTRLVLFLMVGALGLLVHLSVLRTALGLEQSFAVAQTCAVATAIAFNFLLNNSITYADRRLRGWAMLRGLLSFYLVCATGAVANVGVGSLAFASHATWWAAGIAGATIGAVWNYAASSLLTWKKS